MDNKFQLWSPPLLDLSLDSFSNDLLSEFDKSRTTGGGASQKNTDTTVQEQLESLEVNSNNHAHRNNSILSSSPIASSVTLPFSEREISFNEQEEDASSTANLFRKSSTFLKKKLSQSGGGASNSKNNKEENSSISSTTNTTTTTTNAEEISNIISRQYPPKPLHYSPVAEPASDILQSTISYPDNESFMASSSTHTNTLPRSSKDTAASALKSTTNRLSNPISIISTSSNATAAPVVPTLATAPTTSTNNTVTATTTITTPTPPAPKRRSFFSLRFC